MHLLMLGILSFYEKEKKLPKLPNVEQVLAKVKAINAEN